MSQLKYSPKGHSQKKNLQNKKSLPELPSGNNQEEATYCTIGEIPIYIALVETDIKSNKSDDDILNKPGLSELQNSHEIPHINLKTNHQQQDIHETTVINIGIKTRLKTILKQINLRNKICAWLFVAVITAAFTFIAWEVSR